MRRSVLWTLLGMSFCLVAVGCTADSGSASGDVVPSAGGGGYATTSTGAADTPQPGASTPEVEVSGEREEDVSDPGEADPADPEVTEFCTTDEECMNLVAVSACQSVSCLVTSGECVVSPLPDGSDCDAGDPCVTGGACAQGACIGQAVNCDDGDPCTDANCNPQSGCVYEFNTAPCDDGDPCTSGDACSFGACAASAVVDCDDQNPCTSDSCDGLVGCVHSFNNALCDDGDPCTVDICSEGVCVGSPDMNAPECDQGAGCAEGELANCLGSCSPAIQYGDGTCHAALDCAEAQFDGGDCEQSDACGPGQLIGCDGLCTAAWQLNNGTCDAALDCALHNFDGGDCQETGACAPGQVQACDGSCQAEWLLGNGLCDPAFDCADFAFDGGDCQGGPSACPEGELEDCLGQCVGPGQLTSLANGICDAQFNCAAYLDDGGDCELLEQCASFEVPNCEGGCTLANWYGDNQCDAELYCEETQWDGGDCLGTCPYTYYEDCFGGCHEEEPALGDGVCDPLYNCALWEGDGGDCGPVSCADDEITCASDGACVDASFACDGVKDCFDGSDELGCEPGPACAPYEVSDCEGGCVLASWLGDGDCDSELNCVEAAWDEGDCVGVCPDDEFTDCQGQCQADDLELANGLCDEKWNCAAYGFDGGDCAPLPCGASEFTCETSGTCITKAAACDGFPDCPDGSDEAGCEPVSNCASYEVDDCEGGCVLASWLGDGDCDDSLNCVDTAFDEGDCVGVCPSDTFTDCLGGCQASTSGLGDGVCDPIWDCPEYASDMADCEAPGCSASEFTCQSDGTCISKTWVCDAMSDCADGSDEANCVPEGSNCASYEVSDCDEGCTLKSWLGDGECDPILDCAATGYDEGDCEPSGCAPGEFACPGGFLCLPQASVCDGFPNCADGSDELGCGEGSTCGLYELKGCGASCYDASWFGDGSCDDMLNCAEAGWDGGDCDPSGSCTPGQFQCIDDKCIPISWQCDDESDCSQGEDEIGCGVEF